MAHPLSLFCSVPSSKPPYLARGGETPLRAKQRVEQLGLDLARLLSGRLVDCVGDGVESSSSRCGRRSDKYSAAAGEARGGPAAARGERRSGSSPADRGGSSTSSCRERRRGSHVGYGEALHGFDSSSSFFWKGKKERESQEECSSAFSTAKQTRE